MIHEAPPQPDALHRWRNENRHRVLGALHRQWAATVAQLVRLTGLSVSTVRNILLDLEERRLVATDPNPEVRVKRDRGRPPRLFRIVSTDGFVAGLAFGDGSVHVAIADEALKIVAEQRGTIDIDAGADAAINAAADLIDSAWISIAAPRERLRAVGLGAPTSLLRRPRQRFDPASSLSRRLDDIPVIARSDAALGALGLVRALGEEAPPDLVYLKVSTDIDSGIVLGGRPYEGASGSAGQLGHVQVEPDGAVCRCGNRGCLETVASIPALLGALRGRHGDHLGLDDVLELIERRDPATMRVLGDAGLTIGRKLAGVCNMINPSAVVVAGELSHAGSPLLDGVRKSLSRDAHPQIAAAVEIRASTLGVRCIVTGSLQLAAREAGLNAWGRTTARSPSSS